MNGILDLSRHVLMKQRNSIPSVSDSSSKNRSSFSGKETKQALTKGSERRKKEKKKKKNFLNLTANQICQNRKEIDLFPRRLMMRRLDFPDPHLQQCLPPIPSAMIQIPVLL